MTLSDEKNKEKWNKEMKIMWFSKRIRTPFEIFTLDACMGTSNRRRLKPRVHQRSEQSARMNPS